MIAFHECFESRFACAVHAEAGKHYASGLAADVNQQTAAAFAHAWQDRSIHSVNSEDVGLEDSPNLLEGHAFREPSYGKPCIVHQHVDVPDATNHLRHG